MSLVHYESGVFYAWIGGILTTIPIGSGSSGPSNGINQPLAFDGLIESDESYLFGQNGPNLDNVAYINRTNAFTGANSFATNLLDLLVGQLKFPATQNASADANTLDDYEEGNWTPADGSGAGLAFVAATGRYTKIGRAVAITCDIAYPATANGANALIIGLPFVANGTGSLSIGFQNGAAIYTLYVRSGTTQIELYSVATRIINSQLSSSSIVAAGIYFV